MRPVLIDIAGVSIPSYGAAMIAAVALAVMAARRLAVPSRLSPGFVTELCLIAVTFGVIGSKLPLLAFGLVGGAREALLQGGFFDAGLGVAVASIWLYSRRHGHSPLAAADSLAPAAALAESVARLGCLAAGCCVGRPTDFVLSLVYSDPAAARLAGTPLGVSLHAAPLYMSAGCFVIAVVLAFRSAGLPPVGHQFGGYLLGHGVLRCAVGLLRWDALTDVWSVIGATEFAGIVSVILGVVLLRRA